MTFPNDNLEFRQCWSRVVGEVSSLHLVISIVETKAANAFVQRSDEAARRLRDLAIELKEKADEGEQVLKAYIEEADRRDFERTKHLKK